MHGQPKEREVATDWLKILDDEIQSGNKMLKVVPKVLNDPDISLDQVKALFLELERQAQFIEKLKAALEAMGHDFPVVDKATALEARYADLAATAAEKLKELRQ
ncbi:MAG: hypothetical protein JNK47_01500 [Mesorhizobium sp.]|nr:hypothetical protein [Mesorhizobium sp.]